MVSMLPPGSISSYQCDINWLTKLPPQYGTGLLPLDAGNASRRTSTLGTKIEPTYRDSEVWTGWQEFGGIMPLYWSSILEFY